MPEPVCAEDVEAGIRKATPKAIATKASVDVYDKDGKMLIATVWPNRQVDVTWEGSRYA